MCVLLQHRKTKSLLVKRHNNGENYYPALLVYNYHYLHLVLYSSKKNMKPTLKNALAIVSAIIVRSVVNMGIITN